MIFFPDTHEAIISQEVWDQAQRLRERKPRKLSTGKMTHRLSGLIFCGDCGSRMSFLNSETSGRTKDDLFGVLDAKRIGVLNTEIAKAEARKQTLEMKWLDNKLSDNDHDRLCGVIDENIATYRAEVESLKALLEAVPDYDEIEARIANIRKLESVLLSNNNLTTLNMDDEFVDAFVLRIVPYEGKKFKWYLNIGSGRGWSNFDESAYELYDYWTLGFEAARIYRKARNQYLRQNQWEDLHIEVYIRTK